MCHEDDADTRCAYVVLSGVVRVERVAADGTPSLIMLAGAGQVLGEMALITGAPRSATLRAQTDTRLAVLDRVFFDDALVPHPAFVRQVMATLAGRLNDTTCKKDALRSLETSARLARVVRDTVLHFGADHVCHVPLSQSDLADLTLCSREQVNRLLKKWEKRGIVRHHDRILRIDDVAALSALACDADHSG